MNNNRRSQISDLARRFSALTSELDTLKGELEGVRDEEQDSFDNMPESFQEGERGQKAEAAVENLDQAVDALIDLLGADVEGALDRASE